MARTHEKVGCLPKSEHGTRPPNAATPDAAIPDAAIPDAAIHDAAIHDAASPSAADRVEQALKFLEGRWKLVILFRLFGGNVMRFSELERSIPAISQKMLIQQLRQMESDGIVRRIVRDQVPPKVEYRLTDWGQALCPALDALLRWAESRDAGPATMP